MALAKVAGAIAATTVGAMYLNAKHLLVHDVFNGALPGGLGRMVDYLQQREKDSRLSITCDLEDQATNPISKDRPSLLFEGRTWTFAQLWSDVQRAAKWLKDDLKVQRHDVVALDGTNSPEFIILWFALDYLGACPAFINCNLTSQPLAHCIKVCEAKVCLASHDVKSLVEPIEDELAGSDKGAARCQVVYYDEKLIKSLPPLTAEDFKEDPRVGLQIKDSGSLIYTSGTTGMPKGTLLLRGKEILTARSIALYLGLKPGNIMYTCLPLYHGAAHGLCVIPSIWAGSTIVLSRKFSHKTFWPEVRESKADIIQYVGELCRYLVNGPPSPLDKQHNVKKAWGNGMRPDIWETFRQRFGIESINELYAATDGHGTSFNDNRGDFGRYAVGKRGSLWNLVNGNNEKRIKIDVVTQEIVRDANGFAIVCKDGEPGESVYRIFPDIEHLIFAGYYNNDSAAQKRKIRGLFEKDDYWFRSGDMLRQDPDGCLYFVDRLGDTFRWKSENVSTNEVSDVVASFEQIAEANVYGVQVPFADGRCGCAAIVMADGLGEDKFNFDALARHCIGTLPRYAVPIFVRVVKQLQYTTTMKAQKNHLRVEGIDLDKIAESSPKDTLYWLPPNQSTYVPFRRKEWNELSGGQVRL